MSDAEIPEFPQLTPIFDASNLLFLLLEPHVSLHSAYVPPIFPRFSPFFPCVRHVFPLFLLVNDLQPPAWPLTPFSSGPCPVVSTGGGASTSRAEILGPNGI